MKDYVIFFIVLFPGYLSAQSSLAAGGGIIYDESTITFTRFLSNFVSDTDVEGLSILEMREIETSRETFFSEGSSYYLNFATPLLEKRRFTLDGGLGLGYLLFNYNTETVLSTINVLSMDTIPTPVPFSFGPSCSSVSNSFSDFSPKEGTDVQLLMLSIPLQVHYEFIPEVFRVGIGGFIRTPLYSRETLERIELRVDEETGVCFYFLNAIKEEDGSSFSDIQFGASLHADYRFYERFALEVALHQSFTNTFASTLQYQPLELRFGLSYRFKNRKIERLVPVHSHH